MNSIAVPAKVLLIGEYAVVEGGRALLAALKPAFVFQSKSGGAKSHPQSPLGCYLVQNNSSFTIEVLDKGLGAGFGTSTAELIAGSSLLNDKLPETDVLWDWYRSQYPEASGADLITQLAALHTGECFFRVEVGIFKKLKRSVLMKEILIFRSKPEDKLFTHEALAQKRQPLDLNLTNHWLAQVETAFTEVSLQGLVAFNEFADYLSSLKLETPRAHRIRMDFLDDSGVVAVKGCGAGLNDVFLVVKTATDHDDKSIQTIALKHELTYVGTLEESLW
ncbi:MAG: hypothetical protein H7333_02075 [Bdellovibrionales bacterium]|nr:hypothetical protein [Oligoflexia bacterium]